MHEVSLPLSLSARTLLELCDETLSLVFVLALALPATVLDRATSTSESVLERVFCAHFSLRVYRERLDRTRLAQAWTRVAFACNQKNIYHHVSSVHFVSLVLYTTSPRCVTRAQTQASVALLCGP